MHKKWLAVISLLIILPLSGCFEVSQEIWHNPDGSGRVVIEMILSEDMLSFMGLEGDADQNREEILQELDISPDDVSSDDPNVRNVSVISYYDSEQSNFHVIMDVELYDLIKGLPVDEDDGMGGFEFTIIDNNDGTFRFSQKTDMSSEMGEGDLDQASRQLLETFMAGDMYTLKLYVKEFVEADPNAIYDKDNNVIVWEIPMIDMMTSSEPFEFWAVYRLGSSSLIPPLGMGEFPEWVPFVLAGLCCLTLIIIVIVVIVIVLLSRKRKKNMV